jgi:hypothetical protein
MTKDAIDRARNPWFRLAGRVLLQALADYLDAYARGWIVVEDGRATVNPIPIRALPPRHRWGGYLPAYIPLECQELVDFWYGNTVEQWFDFMNIEVSLTTLRNNPRALMTNYQRIVRVLDE